MREGFIGITFPAVSKPDSVVPGWRYWPANALTLINLGAGALVCWWAASEFDLGWAPAEWLSSLGWLDAWMEVLGEDKRRVAGLIWLLVVWMFGQLCDVLDGAVARAMGAQGAQGAMLDSMADLVSSGLAPAFVGMALMMEWQATGVMPDGVASFTVLPLTVLMAAAWRLARFSRQAVQGPESQESNGDKRFDFEGLPAPFAALFWAGLVWTWAQCPGVGCDGLWILGMLGCTLLPLGMVSSLPQVGLKHWGQDKRWDAMRGVWLLAVGSVSIGLGPLGGVLALISYPLFGAIAHRFGTSK